MRIRRQVLPHLDQIVATLKGTLDRNRRVPVWVTSLHLCFWSYLFSVCLVHFVCLWKWLVGRLYTDVPVLFWHVQAACAPDPTPPVMIAKIHHRQHTLLLYHSW